MDRILFACFNCEKQWSANGDYAGKKIRCPDCRAKNTIPSPGDTLADSIANMILDIEVHEDNVEIEE